MKCTCDRFAPTCEMSAPRELWLTGYIYIYIYIYIARCAIAKYFRAQNRHFVNKRIIAYRFAASLIRPSFGRYSDDNKSSDCCAVFSRSSDDQSTAMQYGYCCYYSLYIYIYIYIYICSSLSPTTYFYVILLTVEFDSSWRGGMARYNELT